MLISTTMLAVNALGPIVSGIWLAILGEWGLIGAGVAYMALGVFLIGILIAPGMAFAVGGGALAERGSKVGAIIVSLPALLWTYAVAIGTCVTVFLFAVEHIEWDSNPIPYLVWAFGTATAPWTYMALKEDQASGGNGPASLTAAFLVLACAVAAIWYYFGGADSWTDWAMRIGAIMVLCLFWQLLEISVASSRRF